MTRTNNNTIVNIQVCLKSAYLVDKHNYCMLTDWSVFI